MPRQYLARATVVSFCGGERIYPPASRATQFSVDWVYKRTVQYYPGLRPASLLR
jgi:hypothetical protein